MTLLIIIILLIFLFKPELIKYEILNSIKCWYFTLLPILFPSLILGELLINSKLLYKIITSFYKYLKRFLSIGSPYSLFIIIIAYLFGSPMSGRLAFNAKKHGLIEDLEAKNIVYVFSHMSLPYLIFICTSYKINIIILIISQIIIDIIIFKLLNHKYKSLANNNVKFTPYYEAFLASINSASYILLGILGIIVSFSCLSIILPSFIYPFIEILGGLSNNTITNPLYIIGIISFMGLSLAMQIKLCYKEINILMLLAIKLFSTILLIIVFLIKNHIGY